MLRVYSEKLSRLLGFAPVWFVAATATAATARFALLMLVVPTAWATWRGELDLSGKLDAIEWCLLAFALVWIASAGFGIDPTLSFRLSIPMLAALRWPSNIASTVAASRWRRLRPRAYSAARVPTLVHVRSGQDLAQQEQDDHGAAMAGDRRPDGQRARAAAAPAASDARARSARHAVVRYLCRVSSRPLHDWSDAALTCRKRNLATGRTRNRSSLHRPIQQ